jgi:hypothetical protein
MAWTDHWRVARWPVKVSDLLILFSEENCASLFSVVLQEGLGGGWGFGWGGAIWARYSGLHAWFCSYLYGLCVLFAVGICYSWLYLWFNWKAGIWKFRAFRSMCQKVNFMCIICLYEWIRMITSLCVSVPWNTFEFTGKGWIYNGGK